MDMAICAFRDYKRVKERPEKSHILRADEEAVSITLSALTEEEEQAVRSIYMSGAFEKIDGRAIAARVRRYACEHAYSEATVWRMLKKARRIYAEARGLI